MRPFYDIGPFRLDTEARVLSRDGVTVMLGSRAVGVLTALVGRANEYVSKSALLEAAWQGLVVEEANLAVQISAIRREFARVPGGEAWIETLARRGYRFVGPMIEASPATVGTGASSATAPHRGQFGNLPEILPPLFGRQGEVAAICSLIDEHRIVSIVGAGGIGKTRLAQAVAHRRRQDFQDGAWMVELASVTNPKLLPAAVSQSLGIKLSGKKSARDQVLEALEGRVLLLVLDNCEHLIGAASAFAAETVRRTDQVRLLVTSQELLKIAEEHVYRVLPLALPATSELGDAERASAVELLVGRVQALLPTFALGEHNVVDVVDVCRRLDGLPLAIELAAARVPLLGIAGVRDRLDGRFRILTGGARTALRRHQALREAMAWSHGLLSEEERKIFRRTAVFAGSFTMPVAQAALTDDQLDKWVVLEHLGALVDKSLLVAEPTEPPRYRLLESPRTYALEKLGDAGEIGPMRDRHARAMLQWFEAGWDLAWTTTRESRLERYLPDLDNLRIALDWVEQGEAALHIALVGASGWIWRIADQNLEGWQRARAAWARVDATTPETLEARLQMVCAQTALRTQPGPISRAAATRAAELYRAQGDNQGVFFSLASFAWAAALASDPESGKVATDEMAALIDPAWPPLARCDWLVVRAFVVYVGTPNSLDEVQSLVDEMMDLGSAAGDADKVLTALMWQQLTANLRGDFAEAVRLGRQVVARAREDRFGSSDLTNALGNQALALTQLGALDEALEVSREAALLGSRGALLWQMLDTFALLACKRGRFDEAAIVLGRSEAANEWNGGVREPAEQRAHDEALRRLQEALPGPDVERLLIKGRALSNEEAARIALSQQ